MNYEKCRGGNCGEHELYRDSIDAAVDRIAQLERELKEMREKAEAGRSEAHTRLGAEVRAHAETKRLAEAIIAAYSEGQDLVEYSKRWLHNATEWEADETLGPKWRAVWYRIGAALADYYAAHPGEKKEGACNCVVIGQHVDFSGCAVHRLERAEQSATKGGER